MNIKNFVRKEVFDLTIREYAPKDDSNGKKADLSLNINPYGVSKNVLEALKKMDKSKINHYYPENHELMGEISLYLNIPKENIIIGDGCDGCLHLIANTFIEAGDEVIIPTPTFHRYEFHTKLLGGVCKFIPMDNFELSAEKILNSVSDKTKIIFLCNPNNPTGMAIDPKIKEEIIKKFKGIVVVDEALADVTDVNGSLLLKKYDNLIVVRSFSKTFGLASLRIGYIVAHTDIANQIKKTTSPFQVNGIAQELALIALKDKEHIKLSKEYIQENRKKLINGLELLGLKCTPSLTSNFLVDISPLHSNSKELVNELKNNGIYVTDASIFRLPKDTYIRVAISNEKENSLFMEEMRKLTSELRK
ncbi:MAG: histidinol-phosphate transaminase [Nanoarchaeota archaeon]